MAFIVRKKIRDREYFYLNENKRVEGKVKTKTLAYLGKNKKDAQKKANEIINNNTPQPETRPVQEFKQETVKEEKQTVEEKGVGLVISPVEGGDK